MYQDNSRLDFHALGREIKRKREAKGWTQEYLAQLVDRTPRSIIYFENRGQHLSLNAFYKNVTVISVGFPGDALTASNSSVATLDIFASRRACENTCWGASPNPAFGICFRLKIDFWISFLACYIIIKYHHLHPYYCMALQVWEKHPLFPL